MTPVQLPEVPAQRDCVAFRWEGDPINEASDAPWKYASHWSTPPWNHRPVECLYTTDQLRAYATEAVMAERRRVLALAEKWRALADKFAAAGGDIAIAEAASMRNDANELTALLTQPEQNSGR